MYGKICMLFLQDDERLGICWYFQGDIDEYEKGFLKDFVNDVLRRVKERFEDVIKQKWYMDPRDLYDMFGEVGKIWMI